MRKLIVGGTWDGRAQAAHSPRFVRSFLINLFVRESATWQEVEAFVDAFVRENIVPQDLFEVVEVKIFWMEMRNQTNS